MVIYIGGMALSGQIDVPRKVALATEGQQALAMGLMGLGGLVAIAATLLFVALQLQAMIRHHPSPNRHGAQHETPS
jgi:hypothetical protein